MLQELAEPSHGLKLHPSTRSMRTHCTLRAQTSPRPVVFIFCCLIFFQKLLLKHFLHCFLNFFRPLNTLNFFAHFCKWLFGLPYSFLLTFPAFQIFLQITVLLKVWSFPKLPGFLETWHSSNAFTNLVNRFIRTHPSMITFLFASHKKKQCTLVWPTFV